MRIVAGLLLLALCACTAEDYLPEPVVHTPLAFDPTDQYELAEWWSNDQELLQLADDHSYRLYPSQSRYDRPTQHGRWSRINYAALRLEPYALRDAGPVRVTITRGADELALVIPKMKPMHPVAAAPATIEDGLLGRWESERGDLSIRQGQRYSFTPRVATGQDPAVIAGHRGAWRLEADRLVLLPDAPNLARMELRVEAERAGGEVEGEDESEGDAATLRLIGPDATYEKNSRARDPENSRT